MVIDLKRLASAYDDVFSTDNGQLVLEDIRSFCLIDAQAGSSLTAQECHYRNGMQDLYKYIDALASCKEEK